MATQTDVKATTPLTSTGAFVDQNSGNLARTRIKAIYVVPTGTAGSVVFRDGGASGKTVLTVNTVASATQPTYLSLPGEGLLCETDVHGTITNVGSVTVFYG
jgi:hypothetical protein